MRALDARLVRLAVVSGAIVGSIMVSSVAVAEEPTNEPPATTPEPVEIGGVESDTTVTIVDPPAPLDEVAVIEIVVPATAEPGFDPADPETTAPETTAPDTVDAETGDPETGGDDTAVVEEARVADGQPAGQPMASPAMDTEHPDGPDDGHGSDDGHSDDGHGSGHSGGSGGRGNPYLMNFDVIWLDSDGVRITALEVVVPPDVLAQFELVAGSRTGRGQVTSATCTYPDGGTVLQCRFDNPGHGAGRSGLVVPARPSATYTVTVDWPADGWTITGAGGDAYSARDLCPRGGEGGHETDGHDDGDHSDDHGGGQQGGGHEGGNHEGGGHEGGGHEGGGGQGGSGVVCVHTVTMRQLPAAVEPPDVPNPPEPPAVVTPTVTPPAAAADPAAGVQSVSAIAPRSLPATGSSSAVLGMIALGLVVTGSAALGFTRRSPSPCR